MNLIQFLTFIKKYWFLGLIVAGLVYHFVQVQKMKELMEIANQSHTTQITALKEFHSKEINGREVILKEYEKKIQEIDEKYKKARRTLMQERQAKINQIQKENPEQIAQRIRKLYGFTRIP